MDATLDPGWYAIKCDECKRTIGYTTLVAESAKGGLCVDHYEQRRRAREATLRLGNAASSRA